jgi:hypothetical protein
MEHQNMVSILREISSKESFTREEVKELAFKAYEAGTDSILKEYDLSKRNIIGLSE